MGLPVYWWLGKSLLVQNVGEAQICGFRSLSTDQTSQDVPQPQWQKIGSLAVHQENVHPNTNLNLFVKKICRKDEIFMNPALGRQPS